MIKSPASRIQLERSDLARTSATGSSAVTAPTVADRNLGVRNEALGTLQMPDRAAQAVPSEAEATKIYNELLVNDSNVTMAKPFEGGFVTVSGNTLRFWTNTDN